MGTETFRTSPAVDWVYLVNDAFEEKYSLTPVGTLRWDDRLVGVSR